MTKARNIADLGSNDVIETTATGVDVTGTVTADGLTVDGDMSITGGITFDTESVRQGVLNAEEGFIFNIDSNNNDANVRNFEIRHNTSDETGALVLRASDNGDVSFYEDTGTTAKFVWDSSAESLGIGTSSPASDLHISSSTAKITLTDSDVSRTSEIYAASDNLVLAADTGNAGADSHIRFEVDNSEKMRVDSSGRVGIGTASPSLPLTVDGEVNSLFDNNGTALDATAVFIGNGDSTSQATHARIAVIGSSTSSTGELYFTNRGASTYNAFGSGIRGFKDGGDARDNALSFFTSNSGSQNVERMRLDRFGNLLVGTTDLSGTNGCYIGASGVIEAARSGIVQYLNRKGTDGAIVQFRKDGQLVGSIGVYSNDQLYISRGDQGLKLKNNAVVPIDGSGNDDDNDQDIGLPTARYDDIYATNGTIQTSDRNEKQDIETLSDAEQRVAVACKGLLRKFRWKDAVEKKGDEARIHFGIIAQDLQDAFKAEGLDAGRYAMFISSTWTDEETGEERTRLGVRYPELLAFIIASI